MVDVLGQPLLVRLAIGCEAVGNLERLLEARVSWQQLNQKAGCLIGRVFKIVERVERRGLCLAWLQYVGFVANMYFEFALKLNDKLTYGSLSIREVNGQPMFVMTRTFARDLVCAADIRAALIEIARRADHVEQQLTNADIY